MKSKTNFFRKTSFLKTKNIFSLLDSGLNLRMNKKITFPSKVKSKSEGKKAQVTIFIILAIAIVAGILLFFFFKSRIISPPVPANLENVYSYYLSCIEAETLNGASILGQQGGYIETPEFSPGSEYMPFSSQLDFLGIGVPYWYYISGNGITNMQVPSKELMESQLNDFLKEQIALCNFAQFENQGYEVDLGEISVESTIEKNSIDVEVDQDMAIRFGESIWNGNTHSVSANSNLGMYYNLANKIYEHENDTLFLENYGVDILRLYSPVDGVEIGCSPKIWFIEDIRNDLINALEINVPSLKLKGNYYNLNKEENKYFVTDIGEDVDVNVNFLYSKDWPMKLEAWPTEDGILRADPVGLQEGLGMLGFCYTPYHFVYDFAYPVMIQLYSGNEMFQFPVVVFVNKNKPKEPLEGEAFPDSVPELCKYKNTELKVYTYANNLTPVSANIKFKCFDSSCDIGKTKINSESKDAELIDNFPQCINGFIIAKADGYKTAKYMVDSVNPTSATIFLNREYELNIEVKKGGELLGGGDYAIVTFIEENESNTKTISYPEQKNITLSSGQYEIKSYIYSNSSIELKGISTEKCVDVPDSGFTGFFGMTHKNCFTMDIPGQIVSFAVSGGGTQKYYIGESELENSKNLTISSEDFGIPEKVEDLQNNYNKIDASNLGITFS